MRVIRMHSMKAIEGTLPHMMLLDLQLSLELAPHEPFLKRSDTHEPTPHNIVASYSKHTSDATKRQWRRNRLNIIPLIKITKRVLICCPLETRILNLPHAF